MKSIWGHIHSVCHHSVSIYVRRHSECVSTTQMQQMWNHTQSHLLVSITHMEYIWKDTESACHKKTHKVYVINMWQSHIWNTCEKTQRVRAIRRHIKCMSSIYVNHTYGIHMKTQRVRVIRHVRRHIKCMSSICVNHTYGIHMKRYRECVS